MAAIFKNGRQIFVFIVVSANQWSNNCCNPHNILEFGCIWQISVYNRTWTQTYNITGVYLLVSMETDDNIAILAHIELKNVGIYCHWSWFVLIISTSHSLHYSVPHIIKSICIMVLLKKNETHRTILKEYEHIVT